jgi:hypothetical protein
MAVPFNRNAIGVRVANRRLEACAELRGVGTARKLRYGKRGNRNRAARWFRVYSPTIIIAGQGDVFRGVAVKKWDSLRPSISRNSRDFVVREVPVPTFSQPRCELPPW